MKICVIGLGKIGTIIARKLVNGGHEVVASTLHPERHRDVEKEGIKLYYSNREAAKAADVVILAVKPKDVTKVLKEIRSEVEDKLVISIAAAVPLKIMEKVCPRSRIVRAMPNITALVNEAVTAISPGGKATKEDIELACSIFNLMGEAVVVDEEAMDTVTGFVGSGPAYAFMLIDALADAGVKVGLPKDMALKMAARTVLGSARMILENKGHPSELKDWVVTPGGVTIMGLYELEKRSIRAALMEAVDAAVNKAREITSKISEEVDL